MKIILDSARNLRYCILMGGNCGKLGGGGEREKQKEINKIIRSGLTIGSDEPGPRAGDQGAQNLSENIKSMSLSKLKKEKLTQIEGI